MKNIINILLIVIFCLFPFSINAQNSPSIDVNGWQNATWGMTEGELLQAFRSSLIKLPKTEKQTGKHCDYAIKNYVIDNINFIVSFFMSDSTNKLIEIRLTKEWNANNPTDSYEFNNIAHLLINKYGIAARETNDRDKKTMEWSFPSTTILLSLVNKDMGPKFALLTIWYKSTRGGESDRL